MTAGAAVRRGQALTPAGTDSGTLVVGESPTTPAAPPVCTTSPSETRAVATVFGPDSQGARGHDACPGGGETSGLRIVGVHGPYRLRVGLSISRPTGPDPPPPEQKDGGGQSASEKAPVRAVRPPVPHNASLPAGGPVIGVFPGSGRPNGLLEYFEGDALPYALGRSHWQVPCFRAARSSHHAGQPQQFLAATRA